MHFELVLTLLRRPKTLSRTAESDKFSRVFAHTSQLTPSLSSKSLSELSSPFVFTFSSLFRFKSFRLYYRFCFFTSYVYELVAEIYELHSKQSSACIFEIQTNEKGKR